MITYTPFVYRTTDLKKSIILKKSGHKNITYFWRKNLINLFLVDRDKIRFPIL